MQMLFFSRYVKFGKIVFGQFSQLKYETLIIICKLYKNFYLLYLTNYIKIMIFCFTIVFDFKDFNVFLVLKLLKYQNTHTITYEL